MVKLENVGYAEVGQWVRLTEALYSMQQTLEKQIPETVLVGDMSVVILAADVVAVGAVAAVVVVVVAVAVVAVAVAVAVGAENNSGNQIVEGMLEHQAGEAAVETVTAIVVVVVVAAAVEALLG
ncbi:hypothetical protein BGZ46_002340 [Entomortierella lignicola]|nr:hypothetical protein BGZ46_002340 [Entomortierella lignicola]